MDPAGLPSLLAANGGQRTYIYLHPWPGRYPARIYTLCPQKKKPPNFWQ